MAAGTEPPFLTERDAMVRDTLRDFAERHGLGKYFLYAGRLEEGKRVHVAARYVADFARRFADGSLSDAALGGLGDAELRARLTAVKGVGSWTVDMFSMFSLGRADVLPVGDLAVRKGLNALAGKSGAAALPSPAEMEAAAAAWRPYRSAACWYMWRLNAPSTPATPATPKAPKAKAAAAAAAAAAGRKRARGGGDAGESE